MPYLILSEKGSLYTLGGKGSSWFEIMGPMWNYETIKVPICNPRLPPLTPRVNVFWLVVFPKWNNIWDRYILETLSFYIWHDNFSLIICIIQVMKKGVNDRENCQDMLSSQDMLLFCLIACKFILFFNSK